jgi:hypothetical protein
MKRPTPWTVVRRGLSSSTREEFSDAAYRLVYDDYTLLGTIAQKAGLDKSVTRSLIEDAAAREWRRSWTQFDAVQAASSQTRPTSSQSPSTGPQSGRKRSESGTRASTRPATNVRCWGCGEPLAGKRAGARYHGSACRSRAHRSRRASP